MKKNKDKEKGEQLADVPEGTSSKKKVLLTGRDKDLLAHVAIARYLNFDQIWRLVFDGSPQRARRALKASGLNQSGARRRLAELGQAHLRRLPYVTADGSACLGAYAIAAAGYVAASPSLEYQPGLPSIDVKGQFLAHSIKLNELYVGLALAARRRHLPIAQFPFRWRFTDEGLPWSELNPRSDHAVRRRLVPDAVLELLGKSPARAFIECEMGTHPIVRSDEDHTGAVMAKVRRYASYMTLGGDQPFYAQQFHNDMPAELLFLVHSDVRRASVEKHLAGWRELNRAVNLKVFALTVPEAVAHFAGRLGLPADPAQRAERAPPQLALVPGFQSEAEPLSAENDLRVLVVDGVDDAVSALKEVRHYLRQHPGTGCPFPEYTPRFEQLVALADRLRPGVARRVKS
jgi:hypothetical protein